MFTESGMLPIGVQYEGKFRRAYTLKTLTVRESLERHNAAEEEKARGKDEWMGLLAYAARLDIEGIPREAMTLELMLDKLANDDLSEILAADGRLKKKIARFRGEGEEADDAGALADGHPLGKGRGDDPGGSAGVGGGLDGAEHAAGQEEA